MSRFTKNLYATGETSAASFITGPPTAPVTTTWTEVHRAARRVAGGLREAGIEPGDVIAVLMQAPSQVAPLIQGIWMLRATVTMLQQPTPRTDMDSWSADTARACRMVGARFVLVDGDFAHLAEALNSHGIATQSAAELADCEPVEPVDGDESDIALLQLSSGSTSFPKGIAISHENLHANIQANVAAFGLAPSRDVIVSWLPLFHDMGMIVFFTLPMQLGYPLVKATPREFMASPDLWPRLLAAHRGTMTAAPNFAYDILARTFEKSSDGLFDLSALRVVVNGAEPVDPRTMRRLADAGQRFGLDPGCLLPCYGLAEATLSVALSRPGEGMVTDRIDPLELEHNLVAVPSEADGHREIATVGRVVDGLECRVVDRDGQALPGRHVGNLQVRGSSITNFYLTVDGKMPANDSSGWLDTGDRAYFTPEDRLVICGRSKDIIIVGGRNIYPVDVERQLAGIEGVRPGGAAAVSLGSDGFGILIESHEASDAAVRTRIESEVRTVILRAVDARPKAVRVVMPGTLPKTSSGKLRRAEAAGLFASDSRPGR
ncbi:fatty acyl-AMP ligase [Nocardia sp. NPDC005825]|uniref:fatty acyl-AMP ligase n=1 Tax=unclassified Nocardia TaxID=2637762 RepID=UPI00340A1846